MKKIIEAVGDPSKLHEILENYEQFFSDPDPTQFAVIKVGGGLLDSDAQSGSIADDLAALSEVGLYPTVVHGAGPQLDKAFTKAGLETPKIDGKRTTPKEGALELSSVTQRVGSELVDSIMARRANVDQITWRSGVLLGKLTDSENLASVYSLEIDPEAIAQSIFEENIPIVASTGKKKEVMHSTDQESFVQENVININADTAATAIAVKLGVNKYISLTTTGAVLDFEGVRISELAAEDALKMIKKGHIHSGMVPKITEAVELIENGIDSVAITSPNDLLPELFTNAGKGTIIK